MAGDKTMTEATDEPGYPLRVTRHIAAPPERVWQVMTGQLEDYWCPRPWRTEIVEIDWRSGGRMATIMRGPDGETPEGEGTHCTATTWHWTKEACEQHRTMGFETGWATMADQLAELAEAR